MPYTKIALLIFGAGLMLGLVIVVAEIDRFDRVASGLMAVGLIGVPAGMVADWRRATKAAQKPPKKRAKTPARRSTAAPLRRAARPRKPASPKR
jgi:hypothetical protein